MLTPRNAKLVTTRPVNAHQADTEAFQKILDTLMPGNQPWAKNAPVLIIALAKTQFDNGQPNGAPYSIATA